ncbi:MAG: deoxynucleoside kinase [Anaerolineae bacterium]|nr:deoxynucleoside kinase [Anaerolineae bacterium]
MRASEEGRNLIDRSNDRPPYIVVEGAIGVGKTTLVRMLSDHLDTEMLLEVFEENPFLSKFYESRTRYAFQTQIFFLLSRYRQQQQVTERLTRRPLVADYMFAKDRLFAQLNLAGDEWDVYEQLHGALAEQIARPDLIVYLQADTDVLMGRIAQRDRPYERAMERGYIESLRLAYKEFFAGYRDTPVIGVDTNHLNFVTQPADFQYIVSRMRTALEEGAYQQVLPHLDGARMEGRSHSNTTLADFQRFHVELDRSKGFITDLYFNYLCLSEEVGELASELAELWRTELREAARGQERAVARSEALATRQPRLEEELADCMAYLLKIANYAGINLEAAYCAKMKLNQDRSWAR